MKIVDKNAVFKEYSPAYEVGLIRYYVLHGEKQFEKLYLTFEQNWEKWTNWKIFSIIVIICDRHFETLLYIFKNYLTVMHSLIFGGSQIITIIFKNFQSDG